MKIRFLHTTPSAAPGYPFQPGQVIDVPKITTEVREWIKDGKAELLREPELEVATVGVTERAVGKASRRG